MLKLWHKNHLNPAKIILRCLQRVSSYKKRLVSSSVQFNLFLAFPIRSLRKQCGGSRRVERSPCETPIHDRSGISCFSKRGGGRGLAEGDPPPRKWTGSLFKESEPAHLLKKVNQFTFSIRRKWTDSLFKKVNWAGSLFIWEKWTGSLFKKVDHAGLFSTTLEKHRNAFGFH